MTNRGPLQKPDLGGHGARSLRFMIKEKGGVNADVFIEFLKRLMVGATHPIFLIVDRGPAHRAKKTNAFVETLGGKLRLFFLPLDFFRSGRKSVSAADKKELLSLRALVFNRHMRIGDGRLLQIDFD